MSTSWSGSEIEEFPDKGGIYEFHSQRYQASSSPEIMLVEAGIAQSIRKAA